MSTIAPFDVAAPSEPDSGGPRQPPGPATIQTFLGELLAEQGRLQTPVARFAAAHGNAPDSQLSTLSSQLIPFTAPGPGEQYAFEVDLDSCSGCKACVVACHALNGLEDTESWRDVGLVHGGSYAAPYQQTVTTACHHCADPACLNGCPVLAYEKDPVTGIVRHLDDQCIGCQYCVLKCPYDVPKYSARLGIVRKCDMCHNRLAAGEAPACVQACPTHAISIVKVFTTVGAAPSWSATALSPPDSAQGVSRDHAVEKGGTRPPDAFSSSGVVPTRPEAGFHHLVRATQLPGDCPTASFRLSPSNGATAEPRVDFSRFLAIAPDPAYTQPTTRYLSKRPLPANLLAADAAALRPQPPHWPLVVMLTLLPLAIGGYSAVALTPFAPEQFVIYYMTKAAWVAGAVGLGASVFHLGQPLRAWRIFLGWRRSWLSREAMVFGAWFGLATAALVLPRLVPVVALAGLAGLWCSVMIYVDTRREFWRVASTAPRFYGSAIIAGLAAMLVLSPAAPVAALLALGTLLKLAVEVRALRPLGQFEVDEPAPSPGFKTALLLSGPLRPVFAVRLLLGLGGGVFLPFALATHHVPAGTAWLALALVMAGELAERYLFFRAVVAPKMPGVAGA